ncbi:MAG: sensor histidine kinase [Aquabacterium sp.]
MNALVHRGASDASRLAPAPAGHDARADVGRLASSEPAPWGPDVAEDAHTPWRIRSILAVLVIGCLLPGVLLSGYFILSAYQQQKAYAIRDAQALARAVAANLDRDLASVESGLRVLATSGALATADLPAFDAQARMALPHQHITNYVLIDADGRQRLNTLRPMGSPLPAQGGPPELRRVFDEDRSVLTDLFTGPVTGQPILAMAVPVRRKGQTLYSLGAGLAPRRVAGLLQAHNLPSEWIAAVLDSKGRIVARNRDMDRFLGKSAVPALVNAAHAHREGVVETVTLEGIPVITAYSRSDLFDWSVGVGIPQAALTRELKHAMLVLVGATAVAFALALLLTWWLAVHRIVAPADRLLARMQRMSRGEDPGPPDGRHTSREFAALDQGFAEMSRQLQQREQEKEAKLAAEAASRAKTAFLSRMSHELRTPLNAVLGFAQVLQLDPQEKLSLRQYEMVEQIIRSGQHLLDMISDVLDVSRIEAGTMQVAISEVAAAAVIQECQQMLAVEADRLQLQLNVILPMETARVRADRTRLKQVLLNLMSNAVKYNRPYGEVHVLLEGTPSGWRFTVRDTGMGMTPEQLSHLFEPFNRLGREQQGTPGTGIGLIICRSLLEMMDAHLEVTSQDGQGSTFSFELPRA